jgi:putative FmdB family regulatory protein
VPIYEYKCPNGHLFETFHGMMEPSPEACEVCGAGPLQRVLHPVAVHYKGSGFYSTDYGRKSKQPAKDSGGSEGSGSGSDGGGSGGSDNSGGSGGSGGGSGESGSGGKKTAEA